MYCVCHFVCFRLSLLQFVRFIFLRLLRPAVGVCHLFELTNHWTIAKCYAKIAEACITANATYDFFFT